MAVAEHWDTVYSSKRADEVSWFQDRPDTSLRLLTRFADRGGSAALCGSRFRLEHHEREEHRTPSGALQPFTWVVLRRL